MIWRAEESEVASKPFVEHLDDLRQTVIWCLGSVLVGMLIAWPLSPWILGVLKTPIEWAGRDPEEYLRVLKVAGGLSVFFRILFWTGLLIGAPIVVLAIGRFVFPGLTPKEKRAVRNASGFAVLLFATGVCLCYFITLKVALIMMFRINAWMGLSSEFVELGNYVAFVLKLLLAFGLAFEMPVVLLALGGAGLVSSKQLREKRRHVIVGLLVLAMILTPPDPVTQMMMAVPLVCLYELCIWLIFAKEKRST